MTIFDLVIVSVSCLSVFFDLSVRRIPNWLILFGLIAGIVLSVHQGYGPLVQSVTGFFVGIAVLVVPFAFGWMGAGDVKYFGVVGALLGVTWLPRVFFYSAIIAGLIAVGYAALGFFDLAFFKNSWADMKVAVLSMGRVLPDRINIKSLNGKQSVPWGVAFAAGTIVAYYIDPSGRWAGF